jgi:hypothetical protein
MDLPVNYHETHYTLRRTVRKEYIRLQEGKCCHCGKSLTGFPSDKVMKKSVNKKLFPKGFFDYPVHLHHNHNTGMTIGAVHCLCNAVLWQYHGE